jgi:hypothetical protein
MAMLFTRKPLRIPTREEALLGRDEAIVVPRRTSFSPL